MSLKMTDYFTVVFEGDLRKLGKNPFKIASEFGEPVSVAHGHALDELDEYRDEAVERVLPGDVSAATERNDG